MALRAVIEERDYAVAASVPENDENGEALPQSDRLAIAMRVSWEVERATGRPSVVTVDDDGHDVAAVIELGDAPEEEFEEVAAHFMEAASW